MISRLKKKVIILTTVSLFALLVLIVSGMNLISFVSLKNESDEILSMISQSGGKMPEQISEKPEDSGFKPKDMPRRFSPELQFETRFFMVEMTESGEVIKTDTGKIAAVDAAGAADYAEKAIKISGDKGFIDNFRYLKTKENGNYFITFLDCTRKLDSMKTFLFSSVIVSLAGLLVVVVIMIIISGKIISPIAESYEKQKRFITDASHELKTPLAIIGANIDIVEDDITDKESVEDIRTQIDRLKVLTEDLVTLSRMQEGDNSIIKKEFSFSEAATDVLNGFKAPAESKGISFDASIKENLLIEGDEKSIRRLISIVLDNAVKYTPECGRIEFNLKYNGKSVELECKNTTENEITKENVIHIFDRFYRTDNSRNSQTGGHGVGLSIAKAIVEAHGGKIYAEAPEKFLFIIKADIPQ